MDQIIYRSATLEDVESLTDLRLAFLAKVSRPSMPVPSLRGEPRRYFAESLSTGEFVAYLAVADSRVVASSGLVFHHHPPSITNPTGREAYIMNMYTLPAWRRRGIATRLLNLLVDHARQNNCGKISLHALPNGRSIYINAGFVPVETEMRLDLPPKTKA